MIRLHGALLAATVLVVAGAAKAETAAPGATPAIPDKTAPATSLDARPGTLSDKLGETNGVIRPSGDVDPAMHKAPPQTGTTPVLKPGEVAPQSSKGGLY